MVDGYWSSCCAMSTQSKEASQFDRIGWVTPILTRNGDVNSNGACTSTTCRV